MRKKFPNTMSFVYNSSTHTHENSSTIDGSTLNVIEFLLSTTTSATSNGHSDSNRNDLEDGYTPYRDRPETYIIPIVFAIIFIVGVLGNGTLVIVFLRHRNMRNMPNTYILSLALADLLVIVTCVPFTSTVYTLESWPWGEAVCKLSECAKDISIGVSVFTLTALSAERYCAIVNPLRRLQTKPLTIFVAVLIWILAGLCALPGAIVSNVQEIEISYNKTIFVCSPFPEPDSLNYTHTTYAQYNVVTKALIYYIIPLFIIAFFYGLMAHRLHISARDMPGETSGAQSVAQARARRHVARMVLAFILVFFICFLPHHVFMLWFHLNPTSTEDFDDSWHALRIVGFCLSFTHSCVNPVALYCVSGVFRQYFHRYLCCRNTRRVQRGRTSLNMNCETSFNSTIRKHTQVTQDTLAEYGRQDTFKKHYLTRQSTQDTTIIPLDSGNSRYRKNVCIELDMMRKNITKNSFNENYNKSTAFNS